jgi:hypothetical protein
VTDLSATTLLIAIGVLTLLAIGLTWLAYRRPYAILLALLFGLLLQEQMIRFLRFALEAPGYLIQGASLWKELLLVALILALALRWFRGADLAIRFQGFDLLVLALLLLAMAHSVFSVDPLAGVAAIRNLFEPLLAFYIVRAINPSPRALRKTLWALLGAGVLISVLGIWQALAWDGSTFERWGYLHPDRWIPTVAVDGGFRFRPSSTVAGPNILGSFNALFAALALGLALTTSGRKRWAAAAAFPLFLLGLVYTYSRSGMLTLGVSGAVFLLAILWQPDLRSRGRAFFARRWVLPATLLFIVGFAAALVISGMGARLTGSLTTLTDQFHAQDKVEALSYVLQHPAGIGMGQAGPRDGLFFPDVSIYEVESSLFHLALDMGIWGLALWMAIIGCLWSALWKAWQHGTSSEVRLVAALAACLWPGYLLAFLFLPLMQSMALMAWLWFLSGAGIRE